jgi:hypothetical protein
MHLALPTWAHIALLVAALTCFSIGAANYPARPNLVALGLALLTAALLVGAWR